MNYQKNKDWIDTTDFSFCFRLQYGMVLHVFEDFCLYLFTIFIIFSLQRVYLNLFFLHVFTIFIFSL